MSEKIVWHTEQRRLGELRDWDKNPRRMKERQALQLDKSMEAFGLAEPLVVNLDGGLIGGHQRKHLLLPRYGEDHPVDVRVPSRQLTPREAEELGIRLNRNIGEWDFDALANEFELGDLVDWGFDDFDLGMGVDGSKKEEEPDPVVERWEVPDAIWPTDNEWGVPLLDVNTQATEVVVPVNCYGASGRKARMEGTYHFYTDDYRFEGLWQDPTPIVNARCAAVVEPNFSTNAQMPRAVVLWFTYRKRWLARYWQAFGIKVFADLDVHRSLQDINMIGIPHGWRSYACYMRQSDHVISDLDDFMAAAEACAGDGRFLMLVVGGEEDVQAACKQRPQCVWVPSFEQHFYRNNRQKTQSGKAPKRIGDG